MLADYNHNPYDTRAAKMTFSEVYEEWSKKKYPTPRQRNTKQPLCAWASSSVT